MAMPKSVTKINKDGVQFISNVDRVEYTIAELTKAALRDTAKYIRRIAKEKAPVDTGNLKKNIGTWVRKDKDGKTWLQIGIYDKERAKKKGLKYAFYGMYYEFGSSKQPARPFIKNSVMENIDEIRRIQGQYLSAIDDENKALGLIEEVEEYIEDD